jgi:mannose-6-phosphate isomerase-like protein (cupin superfamily)
MRVRRVVTGQEADGRSVVVEDELVEPVAVALFPGAEFHRIWGDDARPALPNDGTPPSAPSHLPPAEGYRFGMFTMAPKAEGGDLQAHVGEHKANVSDPEAHAGNRQDLDRKRPGQIRQGLDGPPAEDHDPDEALVEIQHKLPGLIDVLEPDGAGMHRTDTVDFNLIVSGEVWLELDDGAEVLLKAGDCVVQNGARHRWRNPSSEPCVMAVAQIGAARRPSKD